MSAEIHKIVESVRALNPRERQELAEVLEREALFLSGPSRKEIARAVFGKYAHVPTSSEQFIARKHEDLGAEY